MKIHRLTLQNFRCFAEKTLEFAPQFNVLIGDNGSGKSAILDGLAIGLRDFLDRTYVRSSPMLMHSHNARRIDRYDNDIPTAERVYPVRVETEGTIAGERIIWSRSHETVHSESVETGAVRRIALRLKHQVNEGHDIVIPLIAYYGTGRMWYQGRPTRDDLIKQNTDMKSLFDVETAPPGSRLDTYSKCLNADTHQKFLEKWLRTYELSVLQRKTPNSTLDGMKRAVGKCMDRWTKITYDILLDELMAEDDTGNRMPTRLLSDGQRNILYMVLDIAYRAVTLNPHFGAQACEQTPGVVLIDEIDLHLHPNWQRRVVNDLRTVFPQIQFIATTHAPLIIQSLQEGELIDLNDGETGEYSGRSPEDILEQEMDVELPQRSRRSLDMIAAAEEYYQVLEQAKTTKNGNLESLKRRLDELTEPFADNEAYIAFLRSERLAAGVTD